jgi:Arc/MetJ-type ribon-helix-helix transcriptional regulator
MSMSYTEAMPKAAKVMVSIPDELLERIDREAGERGTSRSGFLQEAARRELGWPDPARVDAALERGRTALAGAGSFEAAELIRDEREDRDARDRGR